MITRRSRNELDLMRSACRTVGEILLRLAELVRPGITTEDLDRYAEVMKGNSEAFGSRLDRGWVPPTLDDLEAEVQQASKSEPGDST